MRLHLIALLFWASLGAVQAQDRVSQFTQDALIHVVLHEMGHAVIREFDVPILGNEEVLAEDFATVMTHTLFPERAEAIITARAQAHLADGDEVSMFSEHPSDTRRAGQVVCIAYGMDPERHGALAERLGMSDREASACRDRAPEIARAWRRVMAPLWIADDAQVTEVDVDLGDGPVGADLAEAGFDDDLYGAMARIDWHSLIRLRLEGCDGAAFWSRNGRTITLCDEYIARFEDYAPGR